MFILLSSAPLPGGAGGQQLRYPWVLMYGINQGMSTVFCTAINYFLGDALRRMEAERKF